MIRSSNQSYSSAIVLETKQNNISGWWIHESWGVREVTLRPADQEITVFELFGFGNRNLCLLWASIEDGLCNCYVRPVRLDPGKGEIVDGDDVLFCKGFDFNLFLLLWRVCLNDDMRYVTQDPMRFVEKMKEMFDRRFEGEWRKYHRETYPEYRFEVTDQKSAW